MEQIAAAAEVSPSTFFRYFPTKEDVVLFDATDSLMMDEFLRQPAEIGPIEALRRAIHKIYGEMTDEELAREKERQLLVRQVPQLHARAVSEFTNAIEAVCDLLAKKSGRPKNDVSVRAWGGALVGALWSVYAASRDDPDADMIELMDEVLEQLETRMPF